MKKRIVSAFCAAALAVGMVGAPISDSGFSLGSTITASAGGGYDEEYTYGYYKYTINDDNNTIWLTKYSGKESSPVIPTVISGRKVTRIEAECFENNNYITGVNIPEGISFINWDAFRSCSNLSSVKFPSTLTTIENWAFCDCPKLKTVIIPPTVEMIWEYVFGCHFNEASQKQERYSDFKLYVYSGTFGYYYAKENGYNYTLIGDKNLPAYPMYLNTEATGRNAIKFSMDTINNDDIDGFVVYIYDNAKKKYVPYGAVKNNSNGETVKMVSGLKSGTAYAFCVRTYRTVGGRNYYSTGAKYLTVSTLPDNVTGINAAKTGMTAINLTWNKVNGATGYVVYKYNPTKKSYERYAVTKTNSQMITGLTAATNYIFTVKAYRTISHTENYLTNYENLYSPGINNYLTTTLPLNVSFAVASTAKGSAYVKWNKVSGATGYVVLYRTSGGKWQIAGVVNANTNSFTKTGLTSGTAYAFTVRAYRTVGGKNYYSNYTQRGVNIK